MRTRSTVLAALAATLAAPVAGTVLGLGAAHAQVRPGSIDASIYGGYWEGDNTLDTTGTFGLRAGYNINRVIGIEANYGLSPTQLTTRSGASAIDRTSTTKDQLVQEGALNAVLYLNSAFINPYITGGIGFANVDDIYLATNLGVGARFHFTDLISLRADFRGWFSGDAPAEDEFAHFEATLGVTFQFGGDFDIDKDGIENRDDKCPTVAEDKDGFQDEDGCPDPDNDEDKILDDKDKCPNEAEDMDGDQDEDGCPDLDADNDGLDDSVDQCPKEAEDKDGFKDDDGCPDLDNDEDGVPDATDKCPNDAEDKDGFEDADGCPDPDNDKDGFLDAADKCPDQPETVNNFEDADGCPDQAPELKLVKVTQEKIEILQKVFFDNGKAKIQKKSFPVLDEVASVLAAYKDIKNVRVEGHTDDKGRDEANQKLSQARADAVREYLIGKGVDGARLEAVGYGETKPIEDNKTAEGREVNRRVEFTIVGK